MNVSNEEKVNLSEKVNYNQLSLIFTKSTVCQHI